MGTVLSHSLCLTLWTEAHQASLFMGFFRQEYCGKLPCPPPGDLPDPGIKPVSPASQADPLPTEPSRKSIKWALVQRKLRSFCYTWGWGDAFMLFLEAEMTQRTLPSPVFSVPSSQQESSEVPEGPTGLPHAWCRRAWWVWFHHISDNHSPFCTARSLHARITSEDLLNSLHLEGLAFSAALEHTWVEERLLFPRMGSICIPPAILLRGIPGTLN